MEPYRFKHILPDDVFITISDREPAEADLWKGVSPICRGNRPTGYEIMDYFALLIRELGHEDVSVYASRLGLTSEELLTIVCGLSGISFYKWRDRYIILAAAEWMRDLGVSINETAERLRFPTTDAFSHFFIYHTKKKPCDFSRYFKYNNVQGK